MYVCKTLLLCFNVDIFFIRNCGSHAVAAHQERDGRYGGAAWPVHERARAWSRGEFRDGKAWEWGSVLLGCLCGGGMACTYRVVGGEAGDGVPREVPASNNFGVAMRFNAMHRSAYAVVGAPRICMGEGPLGLMTPHAIHIQYIL